MIVLGKKVLIVKRVIVVVTDNKMTIQFPKNYATGRNQRSLNNGHLSHKSLFYRDCGSFILLRDASVMLKNDTIIFSTYIILD